MPVLFTGLTPDMSVEVFEALLPKYKTQVEDILYKILYKVSMWIVFASFNFEFYVQSDIE